MDTWKKRSGVVLGAALLLAVGAFGILSVASAEDGTKAGSDAATVKEAGGTSLQPELKVGIHQVLDVTGMRPEVLKQGFGEGKTVSQILTEQGFDPVEVTARAIAESDRRIDLAVAEGRIAAAESSSLKLSVAGQIAKIIGA
ncbi:MAG: hypothetical protein HY875_05215 [Chloroflexi bacterium]|nr:hypothetical protein [Chloroflexota bacterium]